MSHSTKLVVVRRGTFLLAGSVVLLTVGAYIQTVVGIDPFANLKRTAKQVDPNLGVRLEGASIESYEGEKLKTKAQVDRMDVRQDRQHYDLFGVHNGTFFGNNGAIKFDTPRASWNVAAHQMEAPFGGHIKSKDADLQASKLEFKSDTGMVSIGGTVTGMLNGGKIDAKSVHYNVNNGAFKSGPARWSGKFALSSEEAAQNANDRVWDVDGDTTEIDGDIVTLTNGRATDGAIIVLADKIVKNRKTEVVTATGNVRYFSSKTNMTCDSAVIERKDKKATMSGHVQMLVKAKEKQDTLSDKEGIPPYRPIVPDEIAKSRPTDPGGDRTEEQKKLDDEIRSSKNIHDYPTMCYADKVVYWYAKGNRHAEISGTPQARQELRDQAWRQVWTYMAYYDGEKDTLRMVSTPGVKDTRVIDSIGDDGVADEVTVSTKEGDEKLHALKMKASLPDYSDEIPRADKPKDTAGGTSTKQKPPPPGGKLSGPVGH